MEIENLLKEFNKHFKEDERNFQHIHESLVEIMDMLKSQNQGHDDHSIKMEEQSREIKELRPLLIDYNNSQIIKEFIKTKGAALVAIGGGIAILYTAGSVLWNIIKDFILHTIR